MARPCLMLGLAGLGLSLGSAHAQLVFPGRAVAVTGQSAFGSTTEQFFDLRPPTISPSGILGFTGRTVSGAPAREGLYRWHAGQGSVLARQGEALANHPIVEYQSFVTPVIDGNGRLAFQTSYASTINHTAATPRSAASLND